MTSTAVTDEFSTAGALRLGSVSGRWVVAAAVLGSGIALLDATVVNISAARPRSPGGVFFFLMVDLEVVAGFSPLVAGSALLPVTAIMLLLSERAGALSASIGPRLPLSLGPLVAGCGVLLLLRVGQDASYVADVLPAVSVFGLGMALVVAPLTTMVMGSTDADRAGIGSGINNAVVRAAGLLVVAVLPFVTGISGDDYERPQGICGRIPHRDDRVRGAAYDWWRSRRHHHPQSSVGGCQAPTDPKTILPQSTAHRFNLCTLFRL